MKLTELLLKWLDQTHMKELQAVSMQMIIVLIKS